MNKSAHEMLEQIKRTKRENHTPTVKLDTDTVRILREVWPGSFREGVAWLVKVGAEAVAEEKQVTRKAS